MLNNKSEIIDAIKKVAIVLEDLNEEFIYVGGAVVGLYADDPGAPEVRPTKDIDIVLEIATALELEIIRNKLAKRGIHFAPNEKILCRFKFQNILLDVMATKEVGWAPANQWFKTGFVCRESYNLEDVKINIMPLAYFLASKFVAFKERGTDPRTSHDFEDIVYVLDNCTTLVKDLLKSNEEVKLFLNTEFQRMLNDTSLQEAVRANLEPSTQAERFKLLQDKLIKVLI